MTEKNGAVELELRSRRGRPRNLAARAAILASALDLALERGFRHFTMDDLVTRAGVGKPTIYKYWSSKAAVVADAYFEQVGPEVQFKKTGSALKAIRAQMHALNEVFCGQYGDLIRELLGEAQADSELAQALRERWTAPRREDGRAIIRYGVERGEITDAIDPDVLIDAIWGGMYYRLMVGHGSLTDDYIDQLFHCAIDGARPCLKKPQTRSSKSAKRRNNK